MHKFQVTQLLDMLTAVSVHVGPVRAGRERSRPTGLCPSLCGGVNNQSCLHDLINLTDLMITS